MYVLQIYIVQGLIHFSYVWVLIVQFFTFQPVDNDGSDGDEPDFEDPDVEYDVSDILNHRQNSDGSISYLVRWHNYDERFDTWEPPSSFTNGTSISDYLWRVFGNQRF